MRVKTIDLFKLKLSRYDFTRYGNYTMYVDKLYADIVVKLIKHSFLEE